MAAPLRCYAQPLLLGCFLRRRLLGARLGRALARTALGRTALGRTALGSAARPATARRLLLLAWAVHVHADTPWAACRLNHDDGRAAVLAHLARGLKLAARRQGVAHTTFVVVRAADESLARSLALMRD